jgi:hypothetical protein
MVRPALAEALRAEVDLLTGRTGAARSRFERAFALGCRIGDPCWEGLAERGLGLVQAAEGMSRPPWRTRRWPGCRPDPWAENHLKTVSC